MTTVDSSSATHVCPKCGVAKPLTLEFYAKYPRKKDRPAHWRKSICRECYNNTYREAARKRMQMFVATPEGRLRSRQLSSECKKRKKEKDLNAWRLIRQEETRRRAERKGISYIPRELRTQESTIKKFIESGWISAKQKLKNFLDSSSDEEITCWYAALGKPWSNPRLTEAESYRMRYRLDLEFAIHERMRRQVKKAATNDGVSVLIWRALKQNGESPKTTEMLGYTIAELRTHIERQFTKGMTWNKFMNGEIHIDHIRPKASFDLLDPDQWRACWSLPNLRPLWAKENIAKRNKILHLV